MHVDHQALGLAIFSFLVAAVSIAVGGSMWRELWWLFTRAWRDLRPEDRRREDLGAPDGIERRRP